MGKYSRHLVIRCLLTMRLLTPPHPSSLFAFQNERESKTRSDRPDTWRWAVHGYQLTGEMKMEGECFCLFGFYLTVTPSFSNTRVPFSSYSSRVIQKLSLSFMMSASTAPPRNTMCLRRGGSSILILNFCDGDEAESVNREEEEIITTCWNPRRPARSQK